MINLTEAGYVIMAVSAGLSLFSAIVRKLVVDTKRYNEIRENLKEHQKTIKEATKSGDSKRLKKSQEEMVALSIENLKMAYKPMIITLVPFLLVFTWLKNKYSAAGVVASILGYGFDWFGWYFICAIFISLIVNKILGVT